MVSVIFEAESPERIEYRRGAVFQYLYGAHAWLYRQMIGVYGKVEAADRFWQLWHKDEVGRNFYGKEEYEPLAVQEGYE